MAASPPTVKRTPSGHSYDAEAADDSAAIDRVPAGVADLFLSPPPDGDDEHEAPAAPAAEPPSPALNAAQLTEQAAKGFSGAAAQLPPPKPIAAEEARAAVLAAGAAAYRDRGHAHLHHEDALFMHGSLYAGPPKKPKVLWKSEKKPRKDHDASAWLTATEFEDQEEVMRAKVAQLAELMRLSRHTCVYSGAGISASVVGQAALSGQNKVGWTGAGTSAQPTPTHRALALLGRSGWVHGWVQQNHDGLPQKAGFPQEAICEVHGSWFDPSNPVVKYSGSLKDLECEWMERETEGADLVIVLGTSLGGLFADQVATECAERAAAGASLGSCIINLQQTEQDGKMALKVSGKSDDALQLLLAELGLPALDGALPRWAPVACALVPYDADGVRLPEGSAKPRMWLDLRPGARVRLSRFHNHQGAKQPNTMHVGARKGQKFHGKELQNVGPGLGTVVRLDEATSSFKLNVEGAPMKLGVWWLEAAARGGPALLPVVNQRPVLEDSKGAAALQEHVGAAKAEAAPKGKPAGGASKKGGAAKSAPGKKPAVGGR